MSSSAAPTRDLCADPNHASDSESDEPVEEEDDVDCLQWLLSLDEQAPDSQDDNNQISDRPRLRLHYSDEGVRHRFCTNAQRLLVAALDDGSSRSKNAQLARKALCYRNILSRLNGLDPRDSSFDVSSFFRVEWHKQQPAREKE